MSYEGGSDSSASGGSYDGGSVSSSSDAGYASAGSDSYSSADSGYDSGSELYESGDSGSDYDSELYESGDSGSDYDSELYESGDSDSENGDSPDEETESVPHEVCEDGDDLNSDDGTQENTEENDDSKENSEVVSEENSEEKTEEDSEEDLGKDSEDTEKDAEAEDAEIKEKSEYSDEINDHISSVEELEVYQNANLREENIDGRKCLVKDDIDMDYVDPKSGKTNRELMEMGRAPYDAKTGEKIELHHIGQDYDSPLAELTEDTEHGDCYAALHTKEGESWRNDKQKNNHYNGVQRPNPWKARAKGG